MTMIAGKGYPSRSCPQQVPDPEPAYVPDDRGTLEKRPGLLDRSLERRWRSSDQLPPQPSSGKNDSRVSVRASAASGPPPPMIRVMAFSHDTKPWVYWRSPAA